MLFNSLAFMLFLPIVFIHYWILPHRFRWTLLLVSSYYFYMSWNPKYVVLILFTTIVSFTAGIMMEKHQNSKYKKIILIIAALLCLGVLFFFKYFNFVSESISALLGNFAIKLNPITISLFLPVGISFYTFQTLSYVIDVYNGKIKAEHHFGYYATFVAFFPQLVAGPIERTDNLLPQIKEKKFFNYNQATYGLKLMMWGFFKKLCIADSIAVFVDSVYTSLESNTGFPMLFAVLGFSVQIYCDFSGYSDIAIGTAKLLGINLMTNFKSPYFSSSIREFWSRWHISLSTYFRDYVYIPLGGNRQGKIRHNINLMITFLISGLWHGANWTFVIWGGIHGIAQIVENTFIKRQRDIKNNNIIWKTISIIVVYVFCTLAWVFFRADNITDAVFVLVHIFDGLSGGKHYFNNSIGLNYYHGVKLGILITILVIYDYLSLKFDVIDMISKQKSLFRWTIYILLVMLVFLFATVNSNSFIYFQF